MKIYNTDTKSMCELYYSPGNRWFGSSSAVDISAEFLCRDRDIVFNSEKNFFVASSSTIEWWKNWFEGMEEVDALKEESEKYISREKIELVCQEACSSCAIEDEPTAMKVAIAEAVAEAITEAVAEYDAESKVSSFISALGYGNSDVVYDHAENTIAVRGMSEGEYDEFLELAIHELARESGDDGEESALPDGVCFERIHSSEFVISYNHTSSERASSFDEAIELVREQALANKLDVGNLVIITVNEDDHYVYLSQVDADRDSSGASAFANIELHEI